VTRPRTSPGLHLHRALDHRLEPGSAAAIDLQSGNVDGHSGIERGNASQRRRLAVGIALPEQHIVHLIGGETGPLQDRLDDGRRQLGDRNVAEHAAESSDRGSQGLTDQSIAHSPQVIRRGVEARPG
jgi:hypothetical protein